MRCSNTNGTYSCALNPGHLGRHEVTFRRAGETLTARWVDTYSEVTFTRRRV